MNFYQKDTGKDKAYAINCFKCFRKRDGKTQVQATDHAISEPLNRIFKMKFDISTVTMKKRINSSGKYSQTTVCIEM